MKPTLRAFNRPVAWLLLATAAVLIAVAPAARPASALNAQLAWNPAAPSVMLGATVGADVTIASVSNLGGYDLTIAFPPAVLRMDSLADAGFVTTSGNIVICNPASIDNTLGRASLTCATVAIFGAPGPGVSTSAAATLARASFTALAPGAAALLLTGSTLTDPNDANIAVTVSAGSITVLPACSAGADSDGDGANDCVDNCPSVANPTQINTDGNFTDLSPPKAFDDLTWPNSDASGDACDTDDDNDGRSDTTELAGANCGTFTTPTNLLVRDSDGDRFLDGAECVIGTNPADIASFPLVTACGATTDSDGDGITTAREICFYNTNPLVANTDGDTCADGKEVASINADLTVSATDLSQVAQSFGSYTVPALPHLINFDITKDGNINATDLSQVAQRFGSC